MKHIFDENSLLNSVELAQQQGEQNRKHSNQTCDGKHGRDYESIDAWCFCSITSFSKYVAVCTRLLFVSAAGQIQSSVIFSPSFSGDPWPRFERLISELLTPSPRPPGILTTFSRSPAWRSAIMHVVHTDCKPSEEWDRRNFISKAPVWERCCSVCALHHSLHPVNSLFMPLTHSWMLKLPNLMSSLPFCCPRFWQSSSLTTRG